MAFDFGSYFERALTSARASGGEVVGDCPFCGKPDKLWVSASTGKWICFRCDEGGRPAKLIAELEGITRAQAEAMIFRASLTARKKVTRETLVEKFRAAMTEDGDLDVELPEGFLSVWNREACKWRMPMYLLDRGVTRQAAAHFGIGFCNSGRYSHRVIVPVDCPNGSAWVARATDGSQYPKYLNPADAAFGRLLMGWDDMAGGDFVIVEGVFDVVRLWQHGIPAVATLGKVLHPEQLSLLRCLPRDAAPTIMLDPEEVAAPLQMASRLRWHFGSVYVATLPTGVD
ncbi:hypothetical protein LCGC14_1569180, partial [marine sediment metagenome]